VKQGLPLRGLAIENEASPPRYFPQQPHDLEVAYGVEFVSFEVEAERDRDVSRRLLLFASTTEPSTVPRGCRWSLVLEHLAPNTGKVPSYVQQVFSRTDTGAVAVRHSLAVLGQDAGRGARVCSLTLWTSCC